MSANTMASCKSMIAVAILFVVYCCLLLLFLVFVCKITAFLAYLLYKIMTEICKKRTKCTKIQKKIVNLHRNSCRGNSLEPIYL